MTQRLLDNPHTLISLTTFTTLYQSQNLPISEDIAIIRRLLKNKVLGLFVQSLNCCWRVILYQIKREQALAAAEKLKEQCKSVIQSAYCQGMLFIFLIYLQNQMAHDLGKWLHLLTNKKIDAVMTVATKEFLSQNGS